MKKIITAALFAACGCAVLAGCGPANGGSVTEKTDPTELMGEKVKDTEWGSVFEQEKNYCVKTVVKSGSGENGDTMSEQTSVYCFDGERGHLEMQEKSGGKTTTEAELYVEFGEELTLWQRSKGEDGKWGEWDTETYSAEAYAAFFAGFEIPVFAKDQSSNFEYSESDKGYVVTESGLTAMQETLESFVQGVLEHTDTAAEKAAAEKFVLKINDGKPSACICEVRSDEEELPAQDSEMRQRMRPVPMPVPVPRLRHPAGKRSAIGPQLFGTKTQDEDDPESQPDASAKSERFTITQLYYNYGKVRVELPQDLPSPGDEESA